MSLASSRRSGVESLSVGYLIIAFAVSLLVSWLAEDWWLLIPVFMLLAGAFSVVLGIVMRPREWAVKRRYRSSSYLVFWGGTVCLVGAIWLLGISFPGKAVLLVVVFLLWVGAAAIALSLIRLRKGSRRAQ